jgi:hypothetical protein
MQRLLTMRCDFICVFVIAAMSPWSTAADQPHTSAPPWRSELYPENWQPPHERTNLDFYQDKLLQDFSFAGYQRGERPVPRIEGPIFNVTQAPFGADPSGAKDSTAAIQKAIDAAAEAGGGVVVLPEGLFRIRPPSGSDAALRITHSHIVLRGEGVEKTFLLCTETRMRDKTVLAAQPPETAFPSAPPILITRNLRGPTRILPVANTAAFAVNDWVVVRADITDAWVEEHNEPEWLGHGTHLVGPVYLRQIVAIDADRETLTIDIPTRYALLTRDRARIHQAPELLQEIGFEDLSIGNVEHPGKTGWGANDYQRTGNASHDVHGSYVLSMSGVINSWIRNVHSFHYQENRTGAHILSNGIHVGPEHSRSVTIQNCHFQRPQYGGGGGNGYMYRLTNAQECLVIDSKATFSRHGFALSHMGASGNVFFRCIDSDSGLYTGPEGRFEAYGIGSDHHMYLSHSNLADSCTAIDSFFEAAYRPWGGGVRHNLTAAHSVFWNIRGEGSRTDYVVHSEQSRYGYVIGTHGSQAKVKLDGRGGSKTDPVDHLEGEGLGRSLEPQSLFLDQRLRRGLAPEF